MVKWIAYWGLVAAMLVSPALVEWRRSEAKKAGKSAAGDEPGADKPKARPEDDERTRLDRMELSQLLEHSDDSALEYAVIRRIWAKERDQGEDALTRPERNLERISAMRGQVKNDGFREYFGKSYGDFALETYAALKEMQLESLLPAYEQALAAFPEKKPAADRSERAAQLAALPPDAFAAADAEFQKADPRRVDAELVRYLRAKEAELKLPPIR